MSEERNVKKSWRNEMKLKYYQDGKGNIYELKTELEQIMINDIIELTGKKNKLQNIINELEKWIKENNLGEYRTENVVDTDELLDKLKALKENK